MRRNKCAGGYDEDTVLSVDGLRKEYVVRRWGRKHSLVAVDGVSLEIHPGQTVGIVGVSGSGKSTIARCILQLERPDEGSISLCGQELVTLRGGELRMARRAMRAVFQDPMGSLDPRLPVYRSVESGLYGQGLSDPEREERVGQVLDSVGLTGLSMRRPGELSGGQAQRVAIARAIVAQPALLILDEPTSALDVSIQAQVVELLRGLQESLKLAYLFISHDLAIVAALCDYLLVLRRGKIVEQGPTSKVLGEPGNEYTRGLLAATSHSASGG